MVMPPLLALALLALSPAGPADVARYPWLAPGAVVRTLEEAFPAPEGFHRVELQPGSFGAFLRGLPLWPAGREVRLFDGSVARPPAEPGVAAVAALDVGRRDLQQCADSLLRLWAEWRWAAGTQDGLAIHFTSGDLSRWRDWAAGSRPRVGKRVTWEAGAAAPDASRRSFRAWLDSVFTYAGTLSLQAHSPRIPRQALAPGDFLVTGGSPGHVVLVLDVARDKDGAARMLLGQGYTPAQEFHVLSGADGPWFRVTGAPVQTPFWEPFPWSSLRRFSAEP
jgi:hypothetical protein